MSWAVGFDTDWQRDIGYGVPAICDHPDCNEKIDRGLSYVCGGEPYGGDKGCGLYFCAEHGGGFLCERCTPRDPFEPKSDVDEWTQHKLTDPRWAEWRAEQGLPEPAKCCRHHNRNCEPPYELCCERCTEIRHPSHADGSECIAPDESGNGR